MPEHDNHALQLRGLHDCRRRRCPRRASDQQQHPKCKCRHQPARPRHCLRALPDTCVQRRSDPTRRQQRNPHRAAAVIACGRLFTTLPRFPSLHGTHTWLSSRWSWRNVRCQYARQTTPGETSSNIRAAATRR
ncbi:hypothetical protein XHC_0903 [Xanthomonas hortorum pv. carotae str. M081]|nr:hypothetical protein XHC_0903 [Xanthomonas hortorum pv. carotae str. M081]